MPKASDPEERKLTEEMMALGREELEQNRDVQIRTHHMNLFEETENQKYPITALQIFYVQIERTSYGSGVHKYYHKEMGLYSVQATN